ncbi:MAG: PD-(D/E)XK nuclease family protein [Bdellovibrionaceae bacterium]|nr:PD-(D/E)XK nuclease family protein [Pseudobdellovibrionaceae bacterium]NUM59164.1 PD-(D/E)XK nuclease family protein [Pseudobdellovibrionaceae bacterium]
MLKLIKYKNKSQVEEFFNQTGTLDEQWIIPNLKTKMELKKRLLEKNGFFFEDSVKRIRDLWIYIFNHEFPGYKIISTETYHIVLKKILLHYQQELQLELIDPEKKAKEINYYIPLILDESFDFNSERINDWFAEKEQRSYSLKPEIMINQVITKMFLAEQMLPYEWVTVLLKNKELDLSYYKSNKIFFDLGVEISQSEAELIYKISKHKEIIVFESDYELNRRYQYLVKPYEILNSYTLKSDKINLSETNESNRSTALSKKIRKFSNSIAECRDVVGQVKEWLRVGVSAENIQVVAPQIDSYWAVLEPLLNAEGIVFEKVQSAKIFELPTVNKLVSKLLFYQKKANPEDLERCLFTDKKKASLSFDKFKEVFSSPFLAFDELYEKLASYLAEEMRQEFPIPMSEVNLQQELNCEGFLHLIAPLLERELSSDVLEKIVGQLSQAVNQGVMLSVDFWIDWLISSIKRMEVKKEGAREGAIKVDSLLSSHTFNVDYVYILGADDSFFGQQSPVNIDPLDILSLANDLGFILEHPDYNYRSYELELMTEKANKELIMSFAQSDLMGELKNPCFLWQQWAFQWQILEKECDLHKKTSWEDILSLPLKSLFSLTHANYDLNVFLKDQDASLVSDIEGITFNSLSPSSLKNFAECKFKFFAEKELDLRETDVEEIDLSPKEKGLWYHSLFEKIILNFAEISEKWNRLNTQEEKISFLKETFKEKPPQNLAKNFWDKVADRYFQVINKFIVHELELRKEFPNLVNIGCELKWSVYYDLERYCWVLEKPTKGYLLRGTIDRVLYNKNTNKFWVVDYKLGPNQSKNYDKWLKERHWQLIFYALAIEKNWIPDLKQLVHQKTYESLDSELEVELSQFWVITQWQNKKGFLCNLSSSWFLSDKKMQISKDEKEKLFIAFEKDMVSYFSEIQKRKYPAIPEKEDICQQCDWSYVCRAPHLM